jgi:hypothetical protein
MMLAYGVYIENSAVGVCLVQHYAKKENAEACAKRVSAQRGGLKTFVREESALARWVADFEEI